MSGKLDQSLDQIMQDGGNTGKRGRGGRGGPRRAAQKAKAAIAAPTGGVQKNTKTSKPAPKAPAMATPRAPAQPKGSNKVLISGLPRDINEGQLKDYINQAVAPVRSVIIAYDSKGASRGIATVIMHTPAAASKTLHSVNGVKIDNRPIKVEIIYDGSAVPPPAPERSLAERASKPKSAAAAKEPRNAPKAKAAAPAINGAASKKSEKKGKGGRANRPKKKTADELDAEMQDYFGNESAPAANGAAAPAAAAAATNGAEPVDEVM